MIWRRLIRWLARNDIEQARADGFEAGTLAERMVREGEIRLRCEVAYARGEVAGQRQAFDAVEAECRARQARNVDLEDVNNAKKGRLH